MERLGHGAQAELGTDLPCPQADQRGEHCRERAQMGHGRAEHRCLPYRRKWWWKCLPWRRSLQVRRQECCVRSNKARWPANLCHDGSGEVEALFPDAPGQLAALTGNEPSSPFGDIYGDMPERAGGFVPRGDSGSAARFFYSAKAGPLDRLGSAHATVKPVDLMRWLVRMVTPPGGHVLDPFAGSGTTGIAAMAEAMACTMIDIEAYHVADIERKFALLRGDLAGHIAQHVNRRRPAPIEGTPLFGGAAA